MPSTAPPIVVVMGVSGSGKSTVGRLLAARLGVDYVDGDALHPPANVAKMAAGQPLDDTDRAPWLAAVAGWITARARAGSGGVVACSALRRRYRDTLRDAHRRLWWLHLDAPAPVIAARVARRRGHFMPAALVCSQLAALEPLGADELGAVLDATAPPAAVAAAAADLLRDRDAARGATPV
ncbi:MAG TPA: gluconokinase [Pilimelia sp.]|nr:gluconokinase [Pilimelia sp.]